MVMHKTRSQVRATKEVIEMKKAEGYYVTWFIWDTLSHSYVPYHHEVLGYTDAERYFSAVVLSVDIVKKELYEVTEEEDVLLKEETYMGKAEGCKTGGTLRNEVDPAIKMDCFNYLLSLEHLAERTTYDGRDYVEQSNGAYSGN